MQSNLVRLFLAAAAVAVAVLLFVVLSDDDEPSGTSATEVVEDDGAAGGGKPQQPKTQEPEIATIEVEGGQPVGGVEELEYTVGDRVQVEVTSDLAGDVDVHGYEIEEPVEAGGSVTLDFPAEIEGVFEIELHRHEGEAQIAELTVNPG
jgi:hypothetical protein